MVLLKALPLSYARWNSGVKEGKQALMTPKLASRQDHIPGYTAVPKEKGKQTGWSGRH